MSLKCLVKLSASEPAMYFLILILLEWITIFVPSYIIIFGAVKTVIKVKL